MSNTIAENLIRLQNAKENIANAIIEKGGIIDPDDGLEDFATAILSIPSKDMFEILTTGTGSTSASYTSTVSGKYKLFVIALNSEASTYQLTTSVTLNGNAQSGTTLDYNDYYSSGSNRRNYRVSMFNLNLSTNDIVSMSVSNVNAHSALVYVIMKTSVTNVVKALTTPDGGTSGSYNSDAVAFYGTFNNGTNGSINVSLYNAGTTISTNNPGVDYKSSYIFWLSS